MLFKDFYSLCDFSDTRLLTIFDSDNNVLFVSEYPEEEKEELKEFEEMKISDIWPYNMMGNLCIDIVLEEK